MTTGARPYWIGVRPALRVGLSVCLWVAGSLAGPLVPFAAAQTSAGTEIINVARSTFLPSSSGTLGTPPALIEVFSNPVMTPVTGNACFAMLELVVAPTGTVAPGDPLTYEIRVLNGNGAPLSGVVVELPLDPALAPPSSFTDGIAPGVTGGEVPCSGSYDPIAHRMTWTIPMLLADAGASLELVTAIREPLAAETVIAAQGSVVSEFCPSPEASNVVVSTVVPPLLQLSKAADRSVALPGDTVLFTLVATHTGSQSNLAQTTLVDRLPPAMRYAAGSVRVDDVAVADPLIDADGRTLRLPLGPLDAGASRRVTLVAVVGATARRGEAINVAHVEAETAAGSPLESNRATAAVVIDPGPFRREAHLAGRVFVDDDGDGVSDEGEPGLPGALVLLEDGRGALTDITGRWHIEGVRPGLHVVRLDPSTIAATLTPRAAHAEWAGDAGTRFVTARPSTLVLTDLPVGPPGAPRCRVRAGNRQLVLPWASLFDAEGALGDAGAAHLEAAGRWLADLGVAGASMEVDCDAAPSESTAAVARSAIVEHLAAAAGGNESGVGDESAQGAPDFERMLRLARPATRILAPANGTRASRDRIDVDVLYALGTEPRLSVNGVTVPASRIGTTSRLESRAIAASRFVGVALAPGANRIELRTAEDSSDFASIEVWLPGSAVDLRLDVPAGHWITGGREPALLRVEAIDGAGMRTSSRDVVTLEFEGATPLSVDADPHADGHQARLRDGTVDIRFAPPAAGRVRVRAFSATLEKELFIDVRPGAAAWTVVGLAEARIAGEAGVEGDGGAGPGLEDEFSADGGRVAVFARGPVGKEGSLTLSLDTERERDRDRLDRDFEPDLFYPVPGDSSIATDEAAVQGKLFARYDSPAGYAQWGDFATGLERTELMRYDRRLTGASGRFSDGRLSLQGFAASTDQTVVRDVFNADGTSGPFVLSSSPVVARSETVILETRDRFRSEQVLLRQVARRDIDYDLDPLGGTLLFRGPVQPFDIRLNPVRILVIYESRGAGRDQVAAGGRISLAVSDRVEVGASAVVEEREGSNLSLFGVDLAWRPSPGRSVELELASSDEEIAETAVRFDVASRVRSSFGWELSYRDVPAGFANPTLLSAPESGSRRYGGNVVWQPDGPWRVRGEAFVQGDEALDLERRVAGVDAERKVGPAVVSAGVKSVAANGPATGDVSSMLVSAGVRSSIGRRFSGELLREQAFGDEAVPGYPTRTSAGIGYRLREGTRLFLRQEIESGRGSRQDRTVAGVESRVSDNTTARIDYRLEGAADARALRALTGVETRLEAGRHGAMLLSAARLETTRGDEALDYTTLAAGYEHRRGAYLFSGRYELRLGQSDDRHLLTVSGAFHPRDPWTFFVRERLFITDPDVAARSWRGEGLLGAAYRPRDGTWRFLARVDHTLSDGGAFTTAGGIAPGAVSGSITTTPSVSVPAGGGTAYTRTVAGHDDWALSLAAGARMTARQRLAATVVTRRVAADDELGRPATATSLISLHYTTEVHRRWTAGASLRRFSERESETATWGHGIELGYLAMRNLWLVSGYNFAGFDDGRYEQTESSRSGPFFLLRFKFDERSLARLGDLRLDRE